MILDITPVPKPRQTRSDKWKQRPCVMRYRAFADEVRLRLGVFDLNGHAVTFGIPMPKSWSKTKQEIMDGEPHTQTPDLDNLMKALGDALYTDDSGIHEISLKKVWSRKGFILLEVFRDG